MPSPESNPSVVDPRYGPGGPAHQGRTWPPDHRLHRASVLVERTLNELRVNVTRGHTSDTTSTEELRISFQRYREFFQRLLSA
jgi:hypothetical protein